MPQFFRRWSLSLLVAGAVGVVPCLAQSSSASPQSAPGQSSSSQISVPLTEGQPPVRTSQTGPSPTPSLIDPAGPTVSLETSEAMFDIGVALNACGYDRGLDDSDPVRRRVRDEVNQALVGTAQGRNARDKLCAFIDRHRLEDPARSLAQYVSLGLYLTPPPALTPSVDQQDLPPDANGVIEVLPLVRQLAEDIDLHVIWVENRAAYDEMTNRLHGPLTKMIVDTNYYLKMPASTNGGRHFLVVLEPMLSPAETNARIYGTNYVVVASPKGGQIPMQLVRHAYLHYEIEPLLYAHENSMDRMQPILKAVQESPLAFEFKNDLVSLVIECMIRAIEARTMNTGVAEVRFPANLPRGDLGPYQRAKSLAEQQREAIRQKAVDHDMRQGFVLTQYFFNQLKEFEKNPDSLDEAIGPMVYGMDVDGQIHQARHIAFDAQGEADIMMRSPQKPPQPKELDLAEMKLMKGDVAGAQALAQKALQAHSGEPGRADFILARVYLMNGKMDDAETAFRGTLAAARDPRILAWAHIFLGRIEDVEDNRDGAMAEYRAALTVRDGQPDTKQAAETGLKKPFMLPHQAEDDSSSQGASPSSAPQESQPHPQ
ncbi:MAG TPA: tetratricopeptide repeat protein [Acidobacteriaceae bacterium]